MSQSIHIGQSSLLPDDPTTHYSRAVNFAPGTGETVDLNPPRFRWRYYSPQSTKNSNHTFQFQIANDDKFENLIHDISTPFNFYNTIPPLEGTGPFHWRIGYKEGTTNTFIHWSNTRSFTIAPDAQVWDRSSMANPDFSNVGHPRLLFTKETLPDLRELIQKNEDSQNIFARMQRDADEFIELAWWQNGLPKTDLESAQEAYYQIASKLTHIAFVYRMTQDEKYAPVKEHALAFARYPKGGLSSPEGAGGEKDSNEDATQATEFLALLYDWLYPDLTETERADFVHSLDWRIESFVYDFAWKRNHDGTRPAYVHGSSLSVIGASHGFEGFFDTFPACLAIYEDSEHAREGFHLGINFMAGVGSAHGFSEGWNEGPGYGNSKWAWQVNAMSYLDSVFPGYGVGQNPWVKRTGAFMRLQTPVGLQHAPWGHGSNNTSYFESGHRRAYRKLAYLTGDGRFLANWQAYDWTTKGYLARPWIECALPLWREHPTPVVEENHVRAFPRSGWVMTMSGPPNDPTTYNNGLGMVFAARPRGGYSHSLACDNSFHIFGYGHDLSHAGGATPYGDACSYHSMSHNTILVDGLGQFQGRSDQAAQVIARLIAFEKSGDITYWCGDATLAYPRKPGEVKHWWGGLDDIYKERDARHLTRFNRHVLFVRNKYFVILDDLEASKPTAFTWLYHIKPEGPFNLNAHSGSFTYQIDSVKVDVVHLLGAGQLDIHDMQGNEGLKNPLTGEDYTEDWKSREGDAPFDVAHNLFMTNKEPQKKWRFLSVILPTPPDDNSEYKIERLDNLTIKVTAFGQTDIISFDPNTKHNATVTIDLPTIAKTGLHE
ncbi:MAG: DUF4962 domain-containing protein [Candidatus Latescibacteria bacterium]|jgi:hypothetical protein|nr:DUF4962 domain-containing protein [Candidatus Latescibacterota bacterium]